MPADRRKVLVALSGLSPQVVTEAVFGLAFSTTPAWIVDEIHLITTREGAVRARPSLSCVGNHLSRLCEEYGLPQISFSEDNIHVVRAGEVELDDIRSSDHSRATADFIVSFVRSLAAQADTEIAMSIAGGRKPMGFLGGAALSLFARPQDRLIHVLVSPAALESHPDFFYPPKRQKILRSLEGDQSEIDCSKAQITIAEIPFVRLRDWIPQQLETSATWESTVAATQHTLGPPRLELRPSRCEILAAGQRLQMQRALFAFYAWLAKRALEKQAPLRAPNSQLAQQYTEEYCKAYVDSEGDLLSRTMQALNKEPITAEFLVERRSRVNKYLRRELGWRAQPYLIAATGKRPNTEYCLTIQSESIVIHSD